MTNSAPNPFSLVGRVALVTGSTTALGKVGAKVALNFNNNVARTEKAFAEFKAVGCEVTIVRCDVSSETDVPRFVAEIAAKLGPVDILVLNATPDQPHRHDGWSQIKL